MRKVFLVMVTVVIILCTGCNKKDDNLSQSVENNNISQDVHTHSWVAATCTTATVCTTCGETKGDPLGHDWIMATCTEPKKCSRCLITDGESIGHKWEDATCTSPKTCTRCKETEGKALGHTWVEATCTEAQYCSVCEEIKGKPLGHKVDFEVLTKVDCANDGKEEGTCSVCGQLITNVIPKTNEHLYGDWEVLENASCTANGKEIAYCSICGSTRTRTTEKLSHIDDGKWEIVIPASSISEGKKATHCKVCGEEVQTSKYELSSANGIPILKDADEYSVVGSYTYKNQSSQVLIYVVEAKKTVASTIKLIVKDEDGNVLDTASDSIHLTAGKKNYFRLSIKNDLINSDNEYLFSSNSSSHSRTGTTDAVAVKHYNRSGNDFYITVEQVREGLGEFATLKMLFFDGDNLVKSDESYYHDLEHVGDEAVLSIWVYKVNYTSVDFFYEDN